MDAITFFLSRYGDLHTGLVDGLLAKLPECWTTDGSSVSRSRVATSGPA